MIVRNLGNIHRGPPPGTVQCDHHLLEDACMDTSPATVPLDTSPRSPTAPHPWPPQPEEQRSRAPEFYGFVAWTSTYLLFVLYVLWALLPDAWIVWVGVTWYPNRCAYVIAVQDV